MAGKAKWAIGLAALAAMAGFSAGIGQSNDATAAAAQANSNTHVGVASCGGTTCHGRQEADGAVVRQDELMRWQEPSSATGAHSRAYAVLTNPRSQRIANELGIGNAASAPMCLGCHSDYVPPSRRGPRFQLSDGVGCESCHGGAGGGNRGWLASHYAVGNTHSANVSRGLYPLDNPRARAALCLNCHFGSTGEGQFVNHRIMAAGHPRLVFELDLFSTLQQHHDEDGDYARRKGRTNHVRMWAVGQATALERSLTLFQNQRLGIEGLFPEFYFFDCHTCHRRIYDDPNARPTGIANPARPIPNGFPSYQDENVIMLSAAARAVAPGLADRFDRDSIAFHGALAEGRSPAMAAAAQLRDSARQLADAFASASFNRRQSFAIINAVSAEAIRARYTDYEGSVQAVMAIDTLLNALVSQGTVSEASVSGIRADINAAYAAVREPNAYRPLEFRQALSRASAAIGRLQ
ncbi:MAG: multiheme c-type cytochrome [Pseudomonadota bacterium]